MMKKTIIYFVFLALILFIGSQSIGELYLQVSHARGAQTGHELCAHLHKKQPGIALEKLKNNALAQEVLGFFTIPVQPEVDNNNKAEALRKYFADRAYSKRRADNENADQLYNK